MEYIKTPTLLLDEIKCKKNISSMVQKMNHHHITLRPHFKTHQSHKIGQWFREEGIDSITVSSVKMAEYFARDGWKKITIAFPVNPRELDQIVVLNKSIELDILISDRSVITAFNKQSGKKLNTWIEIDTGYARSGIQDLKLELISQTISDINSCPILNFRGFLSHTGNTYESHDGIQQHFEKAKKRLLELKEQFTTGTQIPELSLGDTPSSTLLNNFEGMDELRPGNFVFYDLMQYQLGVCAINEIAVAVACPVVAKYAERYEAVLYGGAIHFTKEFLEINDKRIYGYLALLNESGWQFVNSKNYLSSISQEHGVLKLEKEIFDKIRVGDLVCVLPVHSCLTSNIMRGYTSLDGTRIDHM